MTHFWGGGSPSPQPSPQGRGGSAVRFGETAGRLVGQAGALLGWRPDEFWRATPAELAAVLAALSLDEGRPASSGDLARLKAMFPDG